MTPDQIKAINAALGTEVDDIAEDKRLMQEEAVRMAAQPTDPVQPQEEEEE